MTRIFFVFVMGICVGCPLISQQAESKRGGAITGTVSSEQMGTIHAQVLAYHLEADHGDIVPHFVCAATVDADGTFRCEQLSEGKYVLIVSIAPFVPKAVNPRLHTETIRPKGPTQTDAYASLLTHRESVLPAVDYYPARGNLGISDLIRLGQREFLSVTIQIDASLMSNLRAKPSQGFPTGDISLFLSGQGFKVPLNMQADVDVSDGSYIWRGLPAGTYYIEESWEDQGIKHTAVERAFISESATGDISLDRAKYVHVRGEVDMSGLGADRPTDKVYLVPVAHDSGVRYTADISKDGAFRFQDVQSGSYRLMTKPGDGVAFRDIVMDGRSVDAGVVMVSDSSPDHSLTFSEAPASGIITGTVELDGSEPRPGVVVQSSDISMSNVFPIDKEGRFVITGVAPGVYRVYAFADIRSIPYNDAAFLGYYTGHAAEADLSDATAVTGIILQCQNSML